MDGERRVWLDALAALMAKAPAEAVLIHTVLNGPRAFEKLDGLGGSRRSKTLKSIVHTVRSVEQCQNGASVFTLAEAQVCDLPLDRADEPCAKSVPRKLIRCIKAMFTKAGLSPPWGA